MAQSKMCWVMMTKTEVKDIAPWHELEQHTPDTGNRANTADITDITDITGAVAIQIHSLDILHLVTCITKAFQ